MASIPQNATSYDTGSKPYKHDVSRGKWTSFQDFYCACMSHSFGVKHFSILPTFLFQEGGILFIIPYTIGLMLFAIPIFFIQSFLGQFSSSGFISVFRIAPIFKGLGYAILCLNLMSACYFVVIAAFPLFFVFASLNPTLPWMTCGNSWNTENCTVLVTKANENDTWFWDTAWSTVEYFHHGLCQFEKKDEIHEFHISWRISLTAILTWIIIGAIILQGIEIMGTILRYFTITITALIIIILLRLLFIEHAMLSVFQFFVPQNIVSIETWLISPLTTRYAFGAGWGTILTLASFNNFKEDISKYSIQVGFSQLGLLILCGFITQITTNFMEEFYHFDIKYYSLQSITVTYATFPYFFGVLNWSNLWSILFFTALFLGELSGCVIQIFSVLTAIFDEYEPLRIYKKEITILLLGILSIFSMFFTTNFGIYFVNRMFHTTGSLALVICFIELMIVIWVYGRLRFQRDVKFMTNITYASWKYYLLRFVTPIFIFFTYFLEEIIEFAGPQSFGFKLSMIFKGSALFIIPIYFYWKFQSSSGHFVERFKRLCRPTDWYPADPIERRNYDDLLASANTEDVSNQLINNTDMDNLEYTDSNDIPNIS